MDQVIISATISADTVRLDPDRRNALPVFHAGSGIWVDLEAIQLYYEQELATDYTLPPDTALMPWSEIPLDEQLAFAAAHAGPAAGRFPAGWQPHPDHIAEFLLANQ